MKAERFDLKLMTGMDTRDFKAFLEKFMIKD